MFLLYVNDMPGAISCEILLYADDTCLVFQAKDIDIISEKLNTEFNKLCDWFVDNKLSIHFWDDKLKISRGRTEVPQHKAINYLGCLGQFRENVNLVSDFENKGDYKIGYIL